MQSTTSVKTLAFIAALSLCGGAAFAQSESGMMEDAVIKADDAAEAEMDAAEAEAEAAVKKDEMMEEQGKKFESEEVEGVQGESTN